MSHIQKLRGKALTWEQFKNSLNSRVDVFILSSQNAQFITRTILRPSDHLEQTVQAILKNHSDYYKWSPTTLEETLWLTADLVDDAPQVSCLVTKQKEPTSVPATASSTTTSLGQRKKPIRFVWPYPGSYSVQLTGSFTEWDKPIQLLSNDAEEWYVDIQLSPGTYEYKFIVDESRWCYDMAEPFIKDNRGNINNIIQIQ
eukprot:TRINITY_DN24256_c0_g1_i1.p1 TRINITY_DN24256_c0_g1~~TRINITY_DN24256_c0_g1_i1.p1  ORF type:complete len:200 (-),score=23.12 TRINITY_DN24256_c0_g1_i1:39-638(-)